MDSENKVKGGVVALEEIRRTLVDPADIRNEVGFQNDVNGLLAMLEEASPPWRAVSPLFAPVHLVPTGGEKNDERQSGPRSRAAVERPLGRVRTPLVQAV
jgi:hypothetical protein